MRAPVASLLCTPLWTTIALAQTPPGARPNDAALTCEQIQAELAPLARQVMQSGALTDITRVNQERQDLMDKRAAEARAEAARRTTQTASESTADAALDMATFGMGSNIRRLFGGGAAKEKAQAEADAQRAKKVQEEDKAQRAKIDKELDRVHATVDTERAGRLVELAEAKKCKMQ